MMMLMNVFSERLMRFCGQRGLQCLLCWLWLSNLLWQPSVQAAEPVPVDLLIERVTVLSPERQAPLPAQQVLIKAGRIVSVLAEDSAKASQIRAHYQGPRLDGQGRFLTPGLMDSHVHVSQPPGLRPSDDNARALTQAFHRQQPRSYLYFGVTQVLDLANTAVGVADFLAQPVKPDLFRCGAAPVQGGYPIHQLPQAQLARLQPDYIVESLLQHGHEGNHSAEAANQQHTPEAVVARIKQSGAHCLKIFVENGFGDAEHLPVYSQDSLHRLRQAATAQQLPLVAHANAFDMQQLALQASPDVLAHGIWNWSGLSADVRQQAIARGQLPEAIKSHLQRIEQAGIGYQPTIQVLERMGALFEAEALADPWLAQVVPAALLRWYQTPAAQWFRQELQQDFGDAPPAVAAAAFKAASARGASAAFYLHQLGHPLLLASDTPSSPTFTHQPGYGTYLEIQAMARAGISLQAIFEAATLNNARLLQLDRDYGTVSVGKIANLLLLNENPLLTSEAWDQIDQVIVHGQVFARAELSARSFRESVEN
jgi:imidazolonepropionase-like amidohydrolase